MHHSHATTQAFTNINILAEAKCETHDPQYHVLKSCYVEALAHPIDRVHQVLPRILDLYQHRPLWPRGIR